MQPFNVLTADGEVLYAWHVLPLGVYGKYEDELRRITPGLADNVTNTPAFDALAKDPESLLVIQCEFAQSSSHLITNVSQFMVTPVMLGKVGGQIPTAP